MGSGRWVIPFAVLPPPPPPPPTHTQRSINRQGTANAFTQQNCPQWSSSVYFAVVFRSGTFLSGLYVLKAIWLTYYIYFHSSAQILRLRHDYFVHETDEIFTAVCRIRVPVFFKYTRTVWPLVLLKGMTLAHTTLQFLVQTETQRKQLTAFYFTTVYFPYEHCRHWLICLNTDKSVNKWKNKIFI